MSWLACPAALPPPSTKRSNREVVFQTAALLKRCFLATYNCLGKLMLFQLQASSRNVTQPVEEALSLHPTPLKLPVWPIKP